MRIFANKCGAIFTGMIFVLIFISDSSTLKICQNEIKGQCEKSNIFFQRSNLVNCSARILPKCSNSVEKLGEGCNLPGLVHRATLAPPWYNKKLYQGGQRFAIKNRFLISFCHYIGAVLVACGNQAGKIILSTGKSHLRERAIPRYIATDQQIWLWYENDLESEIVSISMENIRAIHSAVEMQFPQEIASSINETLKNWKFNEKMWNAVNLDLKDSEIPKKSRHYNENHLKICGKTKIVMNQFGLAAAQFLFVATPFISPDILQILNPTEEEILGWNHLWAVLGYAFGIEDQFNVALQPNLDKIQMFYQEYFQKIILPGLFSIQMESKILVEVLLNIIDAATPDGNKSTPNLTMLVILQETIGIKTLNLQSLLTTSELIGLQGWKILKLFLKYSPQYLMDKLNSNLKEQVNLLGGKWFGQHYKSDMFKAKYVFY